MEEEKRVIKESQHKQLVMDIRKTKYTVNLHFKQGTGETYKDKILKLIKGETDKIRYKFIKDNFVYVLDKSSQKVRLPRKIIKHKKRPIGSFPCLVISAGGCHLLRKCQNLRCEPWARLRQIS